VGTANFNENREPGTFTEAQHFSGADVGAPANVVMHSNFGPNGTSESCHSNTHDRDGMSGMATHRAAARECCRRAAGR
jgi:hypothetical protein